MTIVWEMPQSIDDFARLQGAEGVGEWFTIAADRQAEFYRGTYLDLRYGETMTDIYVDGIVEGFHQLALLDYLSAEVMGKWHGFNYGLDRVRFVSPLTIHERVRLRLGISDVSSRGEGTLVCLDATLEIEHKAKPAMVAAWRVLLMPEDTVASLSHRESEH